MWSRNSVRASSVAIALGLFFYGGEFPLVVETQSNPTDQQQPAQAPTGQPTQAPAESSTGRRPRRTGRTRSGWTWRNGPGQRRRRLHQASSRPSASPRRTTETFRSSARLSHRAGADRSRHQRARRDRVRRQRPHVRARVARLHAGCRRHGRARSGRPHLAPRGRRQRRRLREAHRLRRQARVPALRHAVRCEQRLDDGVERRRGVAVHRHEQRRRR